MAGKKLTWRTEKRTISELKRLPNNPRTITKEKVKRLSERIKKRGFHDVLKIDTNNFILSGNQRHQVLKAQKVAEVVCMVPSRKLTEKERNAVILESNMSDGEFDFDILANEFEEAIVDVDLDVEVYEESDIDSDPLESATKKEREVKCPKCEHVFKILQ